MIVVSGLGIDGGCFSFIMRSYIYIFSTCIPHILVVSIVLGSGFYMFLRPSAISATIQDMDLSIFYSIIPLFKSIICSLRNEQIKCAIKNIMTRMVCSKKIFNLRSLVLSFLVIFIIWQYTEINDLVYYQNLCKFNK
jgi:hypothetical protein